MSHRQPGHRIRLRGPWTVCGPEGPGSGNARAEPFSAHLPAAWRDLFGDRAGRAGFARRFNRPTHLEADERVYIVLADVPDNVQVQVNGHALNPQPALPGEIAFDATAQLQDHNLLKIELTFDPETAPDKIGGLHLPVLIEITDHSR